MAQMRINGFSGMDVDSMVKNLMTARRAPLDKLNQQKTVMEWQRDGYREINSKLFSFKNTKLKNYGLSTSMNPYKATVTGNTEAIKADATANANSIPMEVLVRKLATQASIETNGFGGYGTKLSTTLEKANPGVVHETYGLSINGVDFSFDKTVSISEVVNKINADPKAQATAKYDELTGKLTILSKDFGNNAKLTLDGSSTLLDVFNGVKLNQGGGTVTAGTQAEIFVNDPGQSNVLKFDSNSININGMQMTLLSESGSKGTSKITTQIDTSKALETIKSFVTDYNDLLSTLYTKVEEKKYRDFPPLTTEQKDEMKENDVKLWEEKAKSGLLRGDGILQDTISQMRMEISSNMGKLKDYGITSGKYYENGKLFIDEDKLKAALDKDPQSIMSVFQGTTSTDGIFDKLSATMDKAMTNISDKAGTSKFDGSLTSEYKSESSMGKQLKNYESRISDLQKRLVDIENNYYKQFTAMETAMNKYQSQSSSLFGGASK